MGTPNDNMSDLAGNAVDPSSEGVARRIVEDAWEEVRGSCFVQSQLAAPLSRLPDLSQAEAERRSRVGRDLLARIARLDKTSLSVEVDLSLRLVSFRARLWARESDWYWTVTDPLGMGFFGMFLPTAYCGGFLLSLIHGQLAAFRFTEAGDLDRYLGLVSDYGRLIEQIAARTLGQAQRGMRMPQPQVQQSKDLLTALRAGCSHALAVKRERLEGLSATRFLAELEERIKTVVQPAFDRALAVFSDDYLSQAPQGVGLGQYAAGSEIYTELVKFNTTLDLTPEQVHAKGVERMAQIEASMQSIRAELGFKGDGAAFLGHLNADPRWRETTVEGVRSVFQRYIERLKPHYARYFGSAPRADYSIEPLPEALQGSMTFGYYDPPRPDRPTGLYRFNAKNLTHQALFNIGALTYHELVPGHHLHLCTQRESGSLHSLHRFSLVNAYNEGWAEYAATLAGEIGMYEAPEERYGRLVMDAFLSCRLVVDTGMNALGWSLERARQYLRDHSGMPETEILSESLRYSCDIPAQSLAYKLGDTEILAMRERMRAALGSRFELKDFHAAVLGSGALPLPDLGWYVDRETRRVARERAP
jgi:uncharacterized protein (DUF885 family)